MALGEDAALLPRLRAGEEAAFRELVRRHHARLVRLASVVTGSRARAEEAVQDAWVAVVTGLGGYSGEAPLGAWITGIVVNKARTRAARDGRVVSFADLARSEAEGPALEPERFLPDGHWAERVVPWSSLTPEREAGDRQLLACIGEVLETLPPAQRAVVLLRDVECQEPAAICAALGITEANMRVLLHRARTRLRDAAAALIEPAAAAKRQCGGSGCNGAAGRGTNMKDRPVRFGPAEGAWWMPTCQKVAEQATEYLEKAMPRRERLAVWAHLRICPNCRAFFRQLLGTVALARRAAAVATPPAHDEDRLVALMKAARRPEAG